MSNTVFKDEDGTILSLYHWTNAAFDDFKKSSDIGFHFGTLDAANRRREGKEAVGRGTTTMFKEVYLNIKNPVIIDFDPGRWSVFTSSYKANQYGALSDKQLNELKSMEGYHRGSYDSPAAIELRRMLEENGYDGILYTNAFEGGFSVIAFHPEQIITVAENGVDVKKAHRGADVAFSLPDTDADGNPIDYSKIVESPTIDSVAKDRKLYQPDLRDRFFTTKDRLYIETVDEMYGVYKYLAKAGRKEEAIALIQQARAARSQAQTMIGDVQYDVFSEDGEAIGKGLRKIFAPIRARGENYVRSFEDYLLHRLNIDRMTLESRSLEWTKNERKQLKELQKKRDKTPEDAKRIEELTAQIKAMSFENKPVFGENENRDHTITAEESEKIVAEYEKKNPTWAEKADEIYKYTHTLNLMRQKSGLISSETLELMEKLYPHYVPSYRDKSGLGIGAVRGKNNVEINSTVKRAKGGSSDILEIERSLGEQTLQLMRAANINRLANTIYDVATDVGDDIDVEPVSRRDLLAEEESDPSEKDIEIKPKSNSITFYRNGERVTMKVSKEIFAAFEAINEPTVDFDSAVLSLMKKANNAFKRLVTSWSPAFMLRNPVRDIQDAGINSKHPALFVKNYGAAIVMMLKNDVLWQKYRAYGGWSSTVFETRGFKGEVDARGFEVLGKIVDKNGKSVNVADLLKVLPKSAKSLLVGIENVNAFVEQCTRFAEFVASVEAGDGIYTAINNSAEVTTNFGRRGRLTKKLNATFMPFLNPAIQGFDKMFRNVKEAITGEHVAKGIATLLTKIAVVGIAPMVINLLMYADDDEYEELRETDKENNFLIKAGDTFIKIPRGRVSSVIGGAANRLTRAAQGKDADLRGFAENAISQVTPVENFTRTIFSPIFDAKNNRTWYGTEIEGMEFENTAPSDRYDENTSRIAVALGKALNTSPKKIHYVIDQYSGAIGDFILPATTPKAENDFFTGNFTVNPVTNNKLSSKFYDLYEDAQYRKTAGDELAVYEVKYFNAAKKAAGELFDEKSNVQSENISDSEKIMRTKTIQALINEIYRTAIQDAPAFSQAISAANDVPEEYRYVEAIKTLYGAERALSDYNKDVYEKCTLLNKAGVKFDSLYSYYFSTKSVKAAEKEKVNGNPRKATLQVIKRMPISSNQKLLLVYASGYAVKDGDFPGVSAEMAKKRVLSMILRMKGTKQEKESLAKACGFTVKNGKISL